MRAIGDIYELALKQRLSGHDIINVIHFSLEVVVPTEAAMHDLLQAAANTWKDTFRTRQVSTLTYDAWAARQVAGAGVTYDPTTCRRVGGDVYEGVFSTPIAGDFGSAPTPQMLALVITLRTGLAGRSRRGRVMLGGFALLDVAGDFWSSTLTDAKVVDANAYLTAYGPSGTVPELRWVVWSRQIASGCKPSTVHPHQPVNFAPANPGDSARRINSAIVRPAIISMHRRKIGVGS